MRLLEPFRLSRRPNAFGRSVATATGKSFTEGNEGNKGRTGTEWCSENVRFGARPGSWYGRKVQRRNELLCSNRFAQMGGSTADEISVGGGYRNTRQDMGKERKHLCR
jgi:hypothetical protein